jgi:hypothetical protein
MAVADLPDPAGPPASPPLTVEPAGTVRPEVEETGVHVLGACRDAIAAGELEGGAQMAVLCGRDRSVELYDQRTDKRIGTASGGIGPTGLATDGKDATYVIDSLGEALLVYRRSPFQLIRRVHLGGAPYAIAFDRERWGLWITLNGTNQVAHYRAGWRPVLVDTYASIPDARRIDADNGEITVAGADQTLRLRTK